MIRETALAAALGSAAWALYASPARAQVFHDADDPAHWYDPECCSLLDCAPVPAGAIRAVKGGWQVELRPGDHPLVDGDMSVLVPYGDKRERDTQDEDMHACVSTTGRLLCIYVRRGMF